jgi:hypothetical protein
MMVGICTEQHSVQKEILPKFLIYLFRSHEGEQREIHQFDATRAESDF